MSSNENLVIHLRQILPDILRDTPISLAYLYGSRAIGQSLPTSDVDIALLICQENDHPSPLSPTNRAQLEFAVEGALEKQDVPNPDVRIIDDLPLTFHGEVAIHGIRLYSRNEIARVEFETRTWKAYLDFAPVARMMQQSFLDHVQTHGLYQREH